MQIENRVRKIANKEAADRSVHHRVTRSAKNGDLLWSPLITDRLARTAVDTSIPGKTYSKAREMPPVFRLTTDHWLYRSVPPCRKALSDRWCLLQIWERFCYRLLRVRRLKATRQTYGREISAERVGKALPQHLMRTYGTLFA
jgi:hypothetical protein